MPERPGLSLFSLSGSVPFESFHPFYHGWYEGYRLRYGWAPVYSPICDKGCDTQLPSGEYHLALSKDGGPVVPAPGPVMIQRPSVLHGYYQDHSGERLAGWVVGIAGAVGGIVMIAASAHDDTVCDSDGFCHDRETASGPLLASGIGVLLATGIVGAILATQRDNAEISVEALRISGYGVEREALAALDGQARPQGATLAVHF